MKIRMLVGLAGNEYSLAPGEETDRFENAEAIRLVEAGYAVPVGDKPENTSARAPAETRRARNRG